MSFGHENDRGGAQRPRAGGRPGAGRGGQGGARPRRDERVDPAWPVFDPTRESEGDDPEEREAAAGAEATVEPKLHGGARPGQPSADVRSVQLDSDEEVTAG